MLNRNILVLGASKEVLMLAHRAHYNVVKIVDPAFTEKFDGIDCINETAEALHAEKIKSVLMAFDDPQKKEKLYNFYKSIGFNFVSTHEGTARTPLSNIEGVVMQELSYLSTNCKVGKCVKMNVGSTIMHDGNIGDYCTIAPRATLLGRVKLEEKVFVGGNATILPDVTVGSNSIIGAGAVVTKNVPQNTVARGVPARFYPRELRSINDHIHRETQ